MNEQQAAELLRRYLEGNATPEEIRLVEQWYRELTEKGDWKWKEGEKEAMEASIEQGLLRSIRKAEPAPSRSRLSIHLPLRLKWVAAAALLLGTGAYLLFRDHRPGDLTKTIQPAIQQPAQHDIAPGGNRATLTLANGSTVVLDSAGNGVISLQGNSRITKLSNGQLVINATSTGQEVLYNTIRTPKGGQYQVELPDGSKAWLNAASSLRFPNFFAGRERQVELSGEGYFEITPDASKPFRVIVGKAEIDVLGTAFNINAYADEEDMKTTLIRGSVKVNAPAGGVLLTPGQQLRLAPNGDLRVEKDADIQQVIAWKEGYFQFDGVSLPALMRQLARWYNLEVVYEGKIEEHEFSGKIAQNVNLSAVLNALRLSNVDFRIEGNKLIVK